MTHLALKRILIPRYRPLFATSIISASSSSRSIFSWLKKDDKPKREKMSPQTPTSETSAAPTATAADKAKLSKMQYKVTQEKHTERPFTGKFDKFKELGTYHCVVCDQELFKSEHKFDSGCGWPAFYDSIDPTRIKEVKDDSLGMSRIEVLCSRCDAHLGHVFNDGPKPTRRRFCINSVAMKFVAPSGATVVDEGS